MNRNTLFTVATALIAIVSAASAVARDNSQTVSGEQASVIYGPLTSALTRAQVRAETLEAIRLGVLNYGSDHSPYIAPTEKQLEAIRLAGLKAVSHSVASR
jgi:hypothetical protein